MSDDSELIKATRGYIKKLGGNSAQEIRDFMRIVGDTFSSIELTIMFNNKLGILYPQSSADSKLATDEKLLIPNFESTIAELRAPSKTQAQYSPIHGESIAISGNTVQAEEKLISEINPILVVSDFKERSSSGEKNHRFEASKRDSDTKENISIEFYKNEEIREEERHLRNPISKPQRGDRTFFYRFFRFAVQCYVILLVAVIAFGFFNSSISNLFSFNQEKTLETAVSALSTITKTASQQFAPPLFPLESANELNKLLDEQYDKCWFDINGSYPDSYVPEITVEYAEDGKIIEQPRVVSLPKNSKELALANIAIKAVSRCNPIRIPIEYQKYYRDWRKQIVRIRVN